MRRVQKVLPRQADTLPQSLQLGATCRNEIIERREGRLLVEVKIGQDLAQIAAPRELDGDALHDLLLIAVANHERA